MYLELDDEAVVDEVDVHVSVAARRRRAAEPVLYLNDLYALRAAQRIDGSGYFVHLLADDRPAEDIAKLARIAAVIEHDLLSGTG